MSDGSSPSAREIAPRPVFFIHGTADTSVPVAHLDQLVAAASQASKAHIQTWRVPGVQYVQAFSALPAVYVQRVVAFYESAFGSDGG